MTRATRNALAGAAVCGALAGLAIAARPAPAAPVPDRNDIPAAAERSASHGWPHRPSVREARQVTRFTNREVGAMAARSETWCRNARWDASVWSCWSRLVFTHNELTGGRLPRPQVYRFRTWTRVWEDGSARVFYPGD